MDIVRESPAQASERPDDEESGQGIPRYGLVTAACSDSASSFHGEREEEEENKWENSIKKDVTEDEQITIKFDMKKTPLEKYDLDESAPKEYDPEKSSGMLTSSTDALNLSKLPNFLFGKSDSVVSCDPHEDSEDGEEAKVVSQQNSCARSGHCNSGSADVASWSSVDKALTMSQQTLACSNGKESGFDSEDTRSDSDSNRYSLVLKGSCSLEALQDTNNFQNQRIPCNTAVLNLENNGKFPSSLKNRLPFDRKTNSVPPHIVSLLEGVDSVEKNCMVTAHLEKPLHGQEVGQPNVTSCFTHVPDKKSSLSVCPKGQVLHSAAASPVPVSILELLKPNKAIIDSTKNVLKCEAAEKQTMVKDHMSGFLSEDHVLVEEGHKDAHTRVKNRSGPVSTETKKEQILKASAVESVFKNVEHSRPESNSNLLSCNPLKESVKMDIISHPSFTNIIELENEVKRNVVPRADSALADKCKSVPIHRKQRSYCKVTSRESL